MIGAVSPAARARPRSEPVRSPLQDCGRITAQMICDSLKPKPAAASTYWRGSALIRSIRAMVTVGKIMAASRMPPVSHDFPQPHHLTKTTKPKIPKTMEGRPLSV